MEPPPFFFFEVFGQGKKSLKRSHHPSTSPRRLADVTREEHQRSRPQSSKPTSGSTPHFPESLGAGGTPIWRLRPKGFGRGAFGFCAGGFGYRGPLRIRAGRTIETLPGTGLIVDAPDIGGAHHQPSPHPRRLGVETASADAVSVFNEAYSPLFGF
ncbi:hypothetical protein NDU88_004754 [Pleurodeles waltl]|uniref:Uncharacterized protein n=1 Tax=Pleurodeles waltl TaxID=8319 RepID=A0AAV7W8S5_PLEWA|nr:hypothetical protein NDU88_004754 [Pleurodeles waltl]